MHAYIRITSTTSGSVITGYHAYTESYTHYYPFGMAMPGRTFNSASYRWGFNGMEKDDEVKGNGNSYDFGARLYDSRLGRWWRVDPLFKKYSLISPYVLCLDNPLIFRDTDGRLILDLDGNPVMFIDGKVVGNLDNRTRTFLESLTKTPKGTIALQKAIDIKQQVRFVFNENDNPGYRGKTNVYSKDGKKLTHKEEADFANRENYFVVDINTGKNNDMMDSYSIEHKYNVIGTHEIIGHVGTDGKVHDESHTDLLESSDGIFESSTMEAHMETAIQYSVLYNTPISSTVVNKYLINFTYKGDDMQQKVKNFNTHLETVVNNLIDKSLITKEKGNEYIQQAKTASNNLLEKK
ncbi:MAG: RHS repeat-associated core domain-containing protein [Chitinophagales bacterium]|nr:hypothetical protein [Candidatus Calescibacterium sp.]MDW8274661.1 RHS repeat-associated core domain-containing protein [Chitinophagales bacterium]